MDLAGGLILGGVVCVALVAAYILVNTVSFLAGVRISYTPI